MFDRRFLSPGQKYLPGIYGGLGPLAHTVLEKALISECNSRGITTDQQYPVWLLVNGSPTPDRTRSLQGDPSAFNYLLNYSKFLENAGADFIIMACNTAHAYIPELKKQVHIPYLSLVDSTFHSIATRHSSAKRIGLMATTGTLISQVYSSHASSYGLEIIAPHPKSPLQKHIMASIYDPHFGVKATGSAISSQSKSIISEAIGWYSQMGCDLVIAGCTEISAIVSSFSRPQSTIIDPLREVSRIAISLCYDSDFSYFRDYQRR